MNKTEAMIVVMQYIETIYESISVRPHIYSGRANAIETFVKALEGVMDFLDDGESQRIRYSDYYCEGQFGEETFRSMFERTHDCQLKFVSNGDNKNSCSTESLDEIYAREFALHLQGFLERRRARVQSEPNPHVA